MGYDSWLPKLAKSTNKSAVLVGEDLMNLKNGANPHIWFDLNMPKKYVNYLVERLSKIDKKHAAYYKENGKEYLAKINKIQKLQILLMVQNKSQYTSASQCLTMP